ncbi:MAG: hypothetical protein ACPGXK_16310 [Phycisphaerae bacterium]
MDSMDQINSPQEEAASLELPGNHPGLGDQVYVDRRRMFFETARAHRLAGTATPPVAYLEREQWLWRSIYRELNSMHESSACRIYREGKSALGLCDSVIPQLPDLEQVLFRRNGVQLVPAEGLLHGKTYFQLWADRVMPCTQFLRHDKQPQYTPEPDIIHDVIGHVPPLADTEYVSLIQKIGQLAKRANPDQLEELVRFYWFTIEFGLLMEDGRQVILGAGILSSTGEIEHVLSGEAAIEPFDLDRVLATPLNTTDIQERIFVAPSLAFILEQAEALSRRWDAAR